MSDVFFEETPPYVPDPWRHWQDNLAGKRVPLHEGTPHAGFYRLVSKREYGARKTFTPVAYWPNEEGNALNCRVGDRDVPIQQGEELWVRVCNHPVSEEAYRAVAERNEPWPDEDELVAGMVAGMGHNKPPEEMTLEDLRDKIDPLAEQAKKKLTAGPIIDQAEADRVADLTDALAGFWKIVDDARKAERQPHDEALREIQTKWSPLLIMTELYKDLKYKLTTPWQIAQQKELQKKAEEAAAAGEPLPQEARRPRAGTRGRAQTLRTFKSANITNFDECLHYFRESPDIRATVQDLANKAVRAGIKVPGAELIEEQKTV